MLHNLYFKEILIQIDDFGPDGIFFLNEVEDFGMDSVNLTEYYGVGKTTEFRYGLKVRLVTFYKNGYWVAI